MHSALSLPWTPFGPCSTKLGVSSLLCCSPIYVFKDIRAFVSLSAWNSCAGKMHGKGRNEILAFPFKMQYLLQAGVLDDESVVRPPSLFNNCVFATNCVKCIRTSCDGI